MDAIPWWQSRTMIATIIGGISGLLALTGHTALDPDMQTHLVNDLINALDGLAGVAALVGAYYRTKATAPIKPVINKAP